MQNIGILDNNKLGKYAEKLATFNVVLTSERREHIQKRHPNDYIKYIKYVSTIIQKPDYVLEDIDNKDTIILLKTINGENIQMIIKLQTDIQNKDKSNSIITFWHIRDRNYKSTIRNNKVIYKNIDIYE